MGAVGAGEGNALGSGVGEAVGIAVGGSVVMDPFCKGPSEKLLTKARGYRAVSYTHLTLPTKRIV